MTDVKLPAMGDYRIHARNAAAMWEALSKGHGALLVSTEEVRIVAPSPHHALRAIVLEPDANRTATISSIVDTVLADSGWSLRVVEDASGSLDLASNGLEPYLRMRVMERRPAPLPTTWTAPGTRIVPVDTSGRLADAERIIISVFPPASRGGDPHSRIQPLRVLGIDGWQVWLGYRDGVPASAAYTYHDGVSVGVYQVATLPEHRGHGVARSIMSTILRTYQDDLVTLTATDHGRPLYDALGFETVSAAVWWRPNHTGDDSGQ
jgi:GNAT superfamily N-acetyltransferase